MNVFQLAYYFSIGFFFLLRSLFDLFCCVIEAVSLSITKETEITEEEVKELVAGDKFYSVCSYIAETDEAIDMVEGERVYIIESHNSDWWFVKKNLTEEKGWVPAQYLMDEVSYTIYVQKKLNEKIDKLPVFESK